MYTIVIEFSIPPLDQAMQLVEEETRRYRPTKNYLDFLQSQKASFEVRIYIYSWRGSKISRRYNF